MLKKHTTLILIGLMINLAFSSFAFAQDIDKETRATEKIKIRIAKLGVGGKVIEIIFKDKTKLKGNITEINDNNFILADKKTATSKTISYNQVKKIRKPLTTFQKVGIGVGVGLTVFAVIGAACVLSKGSCGGVVD